MVRRYIAKYWQSVQRMKDLISTEEEEEEEDSKASHLIMNCWSESVTLKKDKRSSETEFNFPEWFVDLETFHSDIVCYVYCQKHH